MDHPALEQGIQAARTGQHQQARALLSQVVRDDPANEQAWLWLSAVVAGDEQKRYCLQRVLALNPHNQAAVRGLELLAGGAPPPPVAPGAPPVETPTAPPGPAPAEERPATLPPAPLRPATEAASEPPPAHMEEGPVTPPPTPVPPPLEPAPKPRAGLLERLGVSPLLAGLAAAVVVLLVAILAIVVIRNATATRVAAGPAVTQAPTPTIPPVTPTVRPTRPTATPTPVPTATPTVPPTPLLAGTDCPFDPVPGVRVKCYDLEVPEDRPADRDATVHLAVARFYSQSSRPSPYPIVFLQGGPGAGTLYYFTRQYNNYSEWVPTLAQDHDLIFFDQRGTGLSYPSLQCWELLWAYNLDVMALDEEEPWSVAERQVAYMDALRECRDRLTAEGVDVSAYTTAASAADVVDLLDALGYEQAELYGVSYGTRLALAVMRDYPERVHSAILDSPVPPQTNMYLASQELEAGALDEMFRNCAADDACRATYPDLEQTYRDLVARFDAEPVALHFYNVLAGVELHAAVVDGTWLRAAVTWGLRSSQGRSIVPRMIYEAQAGDYRALAYFLYLQNYSYCARSLGKAILSECREEILPLSEQELAATMDQRSDADTFLTALDDAGLMIAACRDWGVPAAPPEELQALTSDIPVLVIAGQYDPVTPPVLSEEVVRTLAHSYLVQVPGVGHVPSLETRATCVRQIMQAFLADPGQQPDTACLATLDSIPFQVPLTAADVELEPFEDKAMGVAGVRPAGWLPGAQGQGYLDRMNWGMDPTRVAVQGAVAPVDYWLQHLMAGFAGSGFDEEPQPAGQRQANGLTWNLYTTYTFENPVDIALAVGNRRTILILMVSEPHEHAAMYELVFLPMIDAAVEK